MKKTGKQAVVGVLCIVILVVPAYLFLAASTAFAKAGPDGPKEIITLPWKNEAKKPVPPSFILPKQNRWGCLACHANQNLTKFRDGREVSLFIDPEVIGNSMHEKIACIDCHTNFTYEEHPASNPKDFRKVAGLACMKCHPFQAYLYRKSTHGELALKNELGRLGGKPAEPALCSSCHGFHDVQSPRFEPYRSKFRRAGKEVCGKCHTDRYASFNDYYHGKAYKNGAKDAPVCWDCHNNHLIVRQNKRDSSVTRQNLPKTCGQCHDQPTAMLTSYAPLIHNRTTSLSNNPIYRLIGFLLPLREEKVIEPKEEVAVGETEIVTEPEEEGFFARVLGFFFPKSLRPIKQE